MRCKENEDHKYATSINSLCIACLEENLETIVKASYQAKNEFAIETSNNQRLSSINSIASKMLSDLKTKRNKDEKA